MTIRMIDYEDYDWKVSSVGWLSMNHWDGFGVRTGTFHHCIGDMDIYQQEGDEQRPYTRISVTLNGRNYNRSWKRTWPNNTLSRLCRVFARDVLSNNER